MKKKKTEENKYHSIQFRLNGKSVSCDVESGTVLLDLIRDKFLLKGTKPGCHEGECGACTVLVNDVPVNSCLYLAVNANGKEILTIEGLTPQDGSLHAVQNALVENGAVQCGFCTSGMVMSLHAYIKQYEQRKPVPGAKPEEGSTRESIQKWLEGNLCRCTGYIKIIDAAEKLALSKDL